MIFFKKKKEIEFSQKKKLPNIIYERWVKPFFIKHEKDVDIAVKEAAKELRSTINSAVDKGLGENNM